MGTSKSYGGPKGTASLLPPWAPPPPSLPPPALPPPPDLAPGAAPDAGLPAPGAPAPADALPGPGAPAAGPVAPTPPVPGPPPTSASLPLPNVTWAAPKRAIGRFVASGGTRDAFGPVARGFVRAQGGPKQARRASRSGIAVARQLAGLLVAAPGTVPEIVRFLAAAAAGRSADEVLVLLLDSLAPGGAQNEEAAARSAACTVLGELFETYAAGPTGLNGLTALTPTQVAEVVVKYVATYIFARLMQVLAVRLERGDVTAATACRMERDVRDYVQDRVSQALVPADLAPMSFTADEGQELMEQVFEDAYTIIETWQ